MTFVPINYDDPRYAFLARQIEAKRGLPMGILDAIRTMGERSNANQVSPAGARTVYQFIPSTRRGMIKNYGVDPWSSPEAATEAAALHLLESKKRTGSWDKAIAGYHGGIGAEQGRRGPENRAYTARVGSFDDPTEPYYRDPSDYGYGGYGGLPKNSGVATMPPYINTEKPKETAPVIPGDLGPSVPVPAAAPQTARKRGGLLGALESVFMPDPDSRWAGALRHGLVNAKESQAAYKAGVEKQEIDTAMANAKLKNMLTKGEYQIAGNNVVHFPPNGGPPQIIAPPASPGERERLIERWQSMDDADPAKQLIESMLLGANDPDVLAAKAAQALEAARIRAGATLGAARTRANSTGKGKVAEKPPTGYVLED